KPKNKKPRRGAGRGQALESLYLHSLVARTVCHFVNNTHWVECLRREQRLQNARRASRDNARPRVIHSDREVLVTSRDVPPNHTRDLVASGFVLVLHRLEIRTVIATSRYIEFHVRYDIQNLRHVLLSDLVLNRSAENHVKGRL